MSLIASNPCIDASPMSSTEVNRPAPLAHSVAASSFYVPSGDTALHAVWRRPANGCRSTSSVVISTSIGYERLYAHQSMRRLAESLVRRGASVLTFDWFGDGDSPGTAQSPQLWTTWQRNLADACDWLRLHDQRDQVSLIGFRLGAALAALHAGSRHVDRLALWNPVVSGRSYLRELRAIDRLGEAAHTPAADWIDNEAGGFPLSRETAASIEAFSLEQCACRASRILLAMRSDAPLRRSLVDGFVQSHANVAVVDQSDLGGMLLEPHRGVVPHTSIEEIVQWHEESGRSSLATSVSQFEPSEAALPCCLKLGSVAEKAISDLPLAGVATLPDRFTLNAAKDGDDRNVGPESRDHDDAPTARPWVLLLNAGAATRVGPGRLYVELARSLAAAGFPVLRVDLAGLGDTPAHGGGGENDSYPATALRDVSAALDALERRSPGRRVIVLGLCSGAYNAFQSAVQLPHRSVVEAVLVNPLTYFWRDGMTIDDAPTADLIEENYYWSAALNWTSWKKLLAGRTRLGWRGAANLCWTALQRRWASAMTRETTRTDATNSEDAPDAAIGHPTRDDLSGDLRRAVQRNRRLTAVFSQGDPGHSILMAKAGATARGLSKRGSLAMHFLADADHTFSRDSARARAVQLIVNDLLNRYR